MHESIEALLANLDKRMDSDARSKQEQQEKELAKQQEPEQSKAGHEISESSGRARSNRALY